MLFWLTLGRGGFCPLGIGGAKVAQCGTIINDAGAGSVVSFGSRIKRGTRPLFCSALLFTRLFLFLFAGELMDFFGLEAPQLIPHV